MNIVERRLNSQRWNTYNWFKRHHYYSFFLNRYIQSYGLALHTEPIKTQLSMAEFMLETSYPSRWIIRQTDNSSKYKSEDKF